MRQRDIAGLIGDIIGAACLFAMLWMVPFGVWLFGS